MLASFDERWDGGLLAMYERKIAELTAAKI
jgi:hypothetical protein